MGNARVGRFYVPVFNHGVHQEGTKDTENFFSDLGVGSWDLGFGKFLSS